MFRKRILQKSAGETVQVDTAKHSVCCFWCFQWFGQNHQQEENEKVSFSEWLLGEHLKLEDRPSVSNLVSAF